jgi:hypothetical protein
VGNLKMRHIIFIILTFFIVGCNKSTELGIEIYQVNIPYPDFTKNPEPDCYYCFEPTENDLFETALLRESDIELFDWEKQHIILTEKGKRKMEKLDIPLQGLPVAMTLNGKPVYGFWFWNIFSSFGCDRVYTLPKEDFKIKYGLPRDNTFGEDPRFDKRIKEYRGQ